MGKYPTLAERLERWTWCWIAFANRSVEWMMTVCTQRPQKPCRDINWLSRTSWHYTQAPQCWTLKIGLSIRNSHLDGQLSQTYTLIAHSVLLRLLPPSPLEFFQTPPHWKAQADIIWTGPDWIRPDHTGLQLMILLPWPLEWWFMCLCTHTYILSHMHRHACVCKLKSTYMWLYTCLHASLCNMCVQYIHVYVCICVYVYITVLFNPKDIPMIQTLGICSSFSSVALINTINKSNLGRKKFIST